MSPQKFTHTFWRFTALKAIMIMALFSVQKLFQLFTVSASLMGLVKSF